MKKKAFFCQSLPYPNGFTLIELMVVLAIIGLIIAFSVFGLQGGRQSARDVRRKADLEIIRSALELYKADCNLYPIGTSLSSPLVGGAECSPPGNTYLTSKPLDPADPGRIYVYSSVDGMRYSLCASLEKGGAGVDCGGITSCGTSKPCNYKVTNP